MLRFRPRRCIRYFGDEGKQTSSKKDSSIYQNKKKKQQNIDVERRLDGKTPYRVTIFGRGRLNLPVLALGRRLGSSDGSDSKQRTACKVTPPASSQVSFAHGSGSGCVCVCGSVPSDALVGKRSTLAAMGTAHRTSRLCQESNDRCVNDIAQCSAVAAGRESLSL